MKIIFSHILSFEVKMMKEKESDLKQIELDPGIPSHIVNQYAGDSIDKLRDLERANEKIARDEIGQSNENL